MASNPRLEDKKTALEKVLNAGIVKKSSQLHSLLLYLGEKSLQENGAPLKEYTIGVEALGKAHGYDPRIDPVVRVDIGKLRRKLADFYRKEGAAQPLRLEIPLGQYYPIYVPASKTNGRRFPLKGRRAAYLAGVLLLLGAAWALFHFRGQSGEIVVPDSPVWTAELQAFWGPFLDGRAHVLIVYGNPMFLQLDHVYFRDPFLNDSSKIREYAALEGLKEALRSSRLQPAFIYTGVGEAEALFRVTRLLTTRNVELELQGSNEVSWGRLKDQDVIFLGSEKFNPQLADLPYSPAFAPTSDGVARLSARPGKPSAYRRVYEGPDKQVREDYALISLYRGLGPDTRLMVLSSTLTQGTAAAAEFVTRPDTMRELFERMDMDPDSGQLPEAFQVVIKSKLNAGIPVQVSYHTHEVLGWHPEQALPSGN
ncbi:MAG: hypothetical protein ACRD1R_20570 [Acidobacteriota bacterium]